MMPFVENSTIDSLCLPKNLQLLNLDFPLWSRIFTIVHSSTIRQMGSILICTDDNCDGATPPSECTQTFSIWTTGDPKSLPPQQWPLMEIKFSGVLLLLWYHWEVTVQTQNIMKKRLLLKTVFNANINVSAERWKFFWHLSWLNLLRRMDWYFVKTKTATTSHHPIGFTLTFHKIFAWITNYRL